MMRAHLANILLDKSYKEGDFTLASGRKSDYYFDCRVTSLSAEGSFLIGQLLYRMICGYSALKGVAGMTMGADPLVSAVTYTSRIMSNRYNQLPLLDGMLIRKEPKDHGTGSQCEGTANFEPGDHVMLLEDVITTGGSVLKAATAVEKAGFRVMGIVAILDRDEGGDINIANAGYWCKSLFHASELRSWYQDRKKDAQTVADSRNIFPRFYVK